MSVRTRLTLTYGAIFLLGTLMVLGASWLLMAAHLRRNLGPEADGALRDLASSYALIAGGLGLVSGAFGWAVAGQALRPLTETLERQAALVEAQRQFVANASHELRSPLTVIRTEVDVALADPDATEADLRAMGQVVVEGTERADALLDGLLLLASSRPELARREPFDLAAAAAAAVREVMPEADARGVTVELRVPEGAYRGTDVSGDPALLGRLLVNLLDNAVRYNKPGGAVAVAVTPEADRITLMVENDGQQIAPEDTGRLTQPFERLGRARDASGTGLGLSIVAAVVAAHGGELALNARRAGGLVATVTLPASPALART